MSKPIKPSTQLPPMPPDAAVLASIPFRRLLENLPAGAYTCDAEGLITYFNRQAVLLWGREPKLLDPVDRFCGSFKLFTTDGDVVAHDQCWMALALRDQQGYNAQEIVIERGDGSRVTALAHANPFYDDSGKLLGAVNVLVDISNRKNAEQSHAFLAAIVESSEDAIVSKSLDGRILSWNTSAERLFGYSAQEAIGRPITRIIPNELHDEERSILDRVRNGERLDNFETVRISKEGHRIDVSLTISPIRSADGTVVGASSIARDITLRRQSESAMIALKNELTDQLADARRLHEMSVRLSTTLELQPILDETLRTAVAIDEADFGLLWLCEDNEDSLRIGACLGFDEQVLNAIERVPVGTGACGRCFQSRQRIIIEDMETDAKFESYRESARRANVRAVHSTPLITRSGGVVGVLSTYFRDPHCPSDRETHLIDICARQAVDFIENARLYEQLRENDRRKEEFLATLAHELRNPLAPICNALNLLSLADDLSPGVERVRDIIERQVHQMVRLVDDLLEISRITRGKVELRKEPVELVSVVRTAIETSQPLIDAARHRFAVSLPSESVVFEADPIRLAQVIANLLNNAAKYTEEEGHIWLSARREDNEVVIAVRDTGVGIPHEMLSKIFETFSQLDDTRVRAQGGLGIGLTLSKSLVQLHGGSIEAHSDGAAKGSEFIVRLPILNSAPLAAPTPEPQRDDQQKLPGRHILIVDDARDAVYVLSRMLESMGQKVTSAHDGEAAIASIRRDKPDVVISDIGMPDMSGYDLARRVRKHHELAGVVLVALTGYGDESDRQQAIEAGFDHHLVKPVSFDVLRKLLVSLPKRDAVSVSGQPA